MQVIGIDHTIDGELYPQFMRYLSRHTLRGKVVAIEVFPEYKEAFSKRNPIRIFWDNVIHHVQSRGGKVVLVEKKELADRQGQLFSPMLRFPKTYSRPFFTLLLRRTTRMVQHAEKAGATILLTGPGHAMDIKKILGKKANVRFIEPITDKRIYANQIHFIKRLQQEKPKRFEKIAALLQPALRKPGEPKMKRPRLREKTRVRRRK